LVRARSWPDHPTGARATYELLSQALTRAHATDAHFAAYCVPDIARRLSSRALAELPDGVRIVLLVFDVDDPVAHAACIPARREWLDEQRPRIETFAAATSALAYRTRRGYRLVLRLAAPVVLRDAEDAAAWRRMYLGACAHLSRRYGIVADLQCCDWTHLYRLPRVVRDGRLASPEFIGAPQAIGAWSYAPPPEEAALDLAEARRLATTSKVWRTKLRHLDPSAASAAVSRQWRRGPGRHLGDADRDRIASTLAAPISAVADGRHPLYLALCGAILERGVPPDGLVALVQAVAERAGDDPERVRRRAADARSTVERWKRGEPVAATGVLSRDWPEVARILDDLLPDATRGVARLRAELEAAGEERGDEVTAEQARSQITSALLKQTHEAILVHATLGIGKTELAARALEELGEGILGVADHKKAGELYELLGRRGRVRVQWRRGVTAAVNTDEDGNPSCCRIDEARAVEEAGGSVPDDLCRRCPHRRGCKALRPVGAEGGIIIVPHQLVAATVARRPDLALIVDEAPDLVEVVEVQRAEYAAAASRHGGIPDSITDPVARGRARRAARAWRAAQASPAAVEERGERVAVGAKTGIAEVLAAHRRATILSATPSTDELRGVRPDIHVLDVRAACPSPRTTVVYWSDASRSRFMPGKCIDWGRVVRALRVVLEHARRAGVRRLLLVVPMPIHDALHRSQAQRELDAWISEGREIDVRHFGALRGHNNWLHYDGCATVGDPWPNLPDHRLACAVLGLDPDHARRNLRERAAAELAQAHGRTRDVLREAPAWHIHVGTVAPTGWGPTTAVERMPRRRPGTAAAMPLDELRAAVAALGGQRAAARLAVVPRSSLGRWLAGSHPVPQRAAEALRAAHQRALGPTAGVVVNRPQAAHGGGPLKPLREAVLIGDLVGHLGAPRTLATTPLVALSAVEQTARPVDNGAARAVEARTPGGKPRLAVVPPAVLDSPADVYLGHRAQIAARAVRGGLRSIARLLGHDNEATASWGELTRAQVVLLQRKVEARYRRTTVRVYLSALRQVLLAAGRPDLASHISGHARARREVA
jgi:hypothetical protein